MSTDWTTNKNKKFGNDELFLKMANSFASLGLVEIDDNNSIDKIRKNFYNLYKRHGLCEGNCNWNLFDRYTTSNNYTNDEIDDLVVLSAAITVNKNNNNILYSEDNTQSSIDKRKRLIENEIKKLSNNGLSNDITLTSFFPHLDVVSEIKVNQISGYIPCWELGEETFYGIITYSDSCHTDNDLNKCLEPVPTFIEETYEINTLTDKLVPDATYEWVIQKSELSNIDISEETGLTGAILKCSMKPEGDKTKTIIKLIYTENPGQD